MPIEIDPATGAPIVKDSNASFTPSNDAPTTEGNTQEATKETTSETKDEGAQEQVEVEIPLELPPAPKHLLSKKAFTEAVAEIASRHCSDSVSRVKCTEDIAALLPDW